MPLDRLIAEPMYTFLGVSLRKDSLSMADGDMVRAINADLHRQPGVILMRKGVTPLDETILSDAVRQIGRYNGTLYQVAGNALYREFESILSGFVTGRQVALMPYRPLNDIASWTFITQAPGIRKKDNGITVREWGIDPPTAAPTLSVGSSGNLRGNYTAVYTYVRLDADDNVAHESNPSPTPASSVSLNGERLNIAVVESPDPQVNKIRLYRTLSGGTLHLFDRQIDNDTDTVASNIVDTALGAEVETDNDPPPSMGYLAEYQNHFFGCGDTAHPDYLWYSKRFRPEAWPTDQFVRIGTVDDPLQGLIRMAGFLGVFSQRSKYRVSGNATSGFAWAETLNTRGTVSPQALLATSAGVLFWARDGIFATNFLQPDQELTTNLTPLFEAGRINDYAGIDWTQAHTFSLAEYKRRLYAGYVDLDGQSLMAVYSQDTQQWYHYSHNARSLYYDEVRDQLLLGSYGGMVYILDVGTTDDGATISLDVTTRTMTGSDRFTRKIFKFLKLDVEALDSTGGTVTLYIDDQVVKTISVTATSRTALRAPIRIPDVQGYGWSLKIAGPVQLFGAMMLLAPMEGA